MSRWESIRVQQLFSPPGCENLVFALFANFIFVKTKLRETERNVVGDSLDVFVCEFLGCNQDYFPPGALASGQERSPCRTWHNLKLDESVCLIVPIVETTWSLTDRRDSDGKGRKLRDSPRCSNRNHNESD